MDSSTTVSVKEGDVIAGKYRIEQTLGAGGMGVVFSAMHLQLDQRVAIKLVLPGAPDRVDRFLREARAVVRLRSEHVARVLDVGTLESGEPFMVMEYLEGKDLGRVLEEQGWVSVEAAAELIIQACEAVAEAHSLGIVHRDLKPENLFLTTGVGGQRMVKVLDFGISKVTGGITASATQTRSMMGSPAYMAPEQMRSSRDAIPQSDVWALGVVLRELLTLTMPFEAESIPELCLKVVDDPPRSPLLDRPTLPPEIVAVIDRCLEKDPARRYADAAQLATALEPFVSSATRVIAERARRVILRGDRASNMPGPLTSQPSTPRPSRFAPPSPRADSHRHSTLAATAAEGPPRPSSPPLLAVALGLAAAGLVGLLAPRARRAEPAVLQVSAAALALSAPGAAEPPPGEASDPGPSSSAPTAASAAPPPSAATPALAPQPRPSPPAQAQAPRAHRGGGRPVPKGITGSAARPAGADDEIPSIR